MDLLEFVIRMSEKVGKSAGTRRNELWGAWQTAVHSHTHRLEASKAILEPVTQFWSRGLRLWETRLVRGRTKGRTPGPRFFHSKIVPGRASTYRKQLPVRGAGRPAPELHEAQKIKARSRDWLRGFLPMTA